MHCVIFDANNGNENYAMRKENITQRIASKITGKIQRDVMRQNYRMF